MFYKMTVDFGGVNFPKPYKDPNKLYIGFVSIFTGCKRAIEGHPCKDCQNPTLWDMGGIVPYHRVSEVKDFITRKLDVFAGIPSIPPVEFFYCVLGGEPLDQDPNELIQVHAAVTSAFQREIPTVLYTGYKSIELVPMPVHAYVKSRVDYLKVGPYLGNEQKQDDLESGLATANQYWLKLRSR